MGIISDYVRMFYQFLGVLSTENGPDHDQHQVGLSEVPYIMILMRNLGPIYWPLSV